MSVGAEVVSLVLDDREDRQCRFGAGVLRDDMARYRRPDFSIYLYDRYLARNEWPCDLSDDDYRTLCLLICEAEGA